MDVRVDSLNWKSLISNLRDRKDLSTSHSSGLKDALIWKLHSTSQRTCMARMSMLRSMWETTAEKLLGKWGWVVMEFFHSVCLFYDLVRAAFSIWSSVGRIVMIEKRKKGKKKREVQMKAKQLGIGTFFLVHSTIPNSGCYTRCKTFVSTQMSVLTVVWLSWAVA